MNSREPRAVSPEPDRRPPVVVNIKRDEFDVYCGRAWRGAAVGPGKIRHLPGSLWGNPFTVASIQKSAPKRLAPERARTECIRRYEAMLRGLLASGRDGPFWREQLRRLTGLRLGCWCAPEPCHCDVLVKLWGELFGNSDQRSAVSDQPDGGRR